MPSDELHLTLAGGGHMVADGDAAEPGLPVFHPKGGVIRKVMEDYSRMRHQEQKNQVPVDDAIAEIVTAVAERLQV